jgi:nucleoside-diphosphate-sugar epimerase
MSNEHSYPTDVVLAGATGALGGRIARKLRARDARVTALVRRGTASERSAHLRDIGVTVVEVDFGNVAEVTAACARAGCVVSALNGLRGTIVEMQTTLLTGAIAAGVPRFIPSDFSLDFTKTTPGTNRNLDLRREFHERLDKAAIQSTSILNGAFMELLTGQAPFILFRFKRALYWGDADQLMDFTTMDDVAAFTAAAALDATTPRFLRIAGDQISARGLAQAVGDVTGTPFRLFRAGSLGRLALLIRLIRSVAPARDDVFPPWQGMQYMRDMFDGRGKLAPLDNARYPELHWTSARESLAAR